MQLITGTNSQRDREIKEYDGREGDEEIQGAKNERLDFLNIFIRKSFFYL